MESSHPQLHFTFVYVCIPSTVTTVFTVLSAFTAVGDVKNDSSRKHAHIAHVFLKPSLQPDKL